MFRSKVKNRFSALWRAFTKKKKWQVMEQPQKALRTVPAPCFECRRLVRLLITGTGELWRTCRIEFCQWCYRFADDFRSRCLCDCCRLPTLTAVMFALITAWKPPRRRTGRWLERLSKSGANLCVGLEADPLALNTACRMPFVRNQSKIFCRK